MGNPLSKVNKAAQCMANTLADVATHANPALDQVKETLGTHINPTVDQARETMAGHLNPALDTVSSVAPYAKGLMVVSGVTAVVSCAIQLRAEVVKEKQREKMYELKLKMCFLPMSELLLTMFAYKLTEFSDVICITTDIGFCDAVKGVLVKAGGDLKKRIHMLPPINHITLGETESEDARVLLYFHAFEKWTIPQLTLELREFHAQQQWKMEASTYPSCGENMVTIEHLCVRTKDLHHWDWDTSSVTRLSSDHVNIEEIGFPDLTDVIQSRFQEIKSTKVNWLTNMVSTYSHEAGEVMEEVREQVAPYILNNEYELKVRRDASLPAPS